MDDISREPQPEGARPERPGLRGPAEVVRLDESLVDELDTVEAEGAAGWSRNDRLSTTRLVIDPMDHGEDSADPDATPDPSADEPDTADDAGLDAATDPESHDSETVEPEAVGAEAVDAAAVDAEAADSQTLGTAGVASPEGAADELEAAVDAPLASEEEESVETAEPATELATAELATAELASTEAATDETATTETGTTDTATAEADDAAGAEEAAFDAGVTSEPDRPVPTVDELVDEEGVAPAVAEPMIAAAAAEGFEDGEPPELTDPVELAKVLMAVLMTARETMKPLRLAEICNSTQAAVKAGLEHLEGVFREQGLPLTVQWSGETVKIMTVADMFPWLERIKKAKKPERLSPAALETLAVIAYRQPVIRAEIEAIRGVKVGPMLKSLLDHKLVSAQGREDVPGRPLQYGTTDKFLERFGLKSLKDLPSVQEFRALG